MEAAIATEAAPAPPSTWRLGLRALGDFTVVGVLGMAGLFLLLLPMAMADHAPSFAVWGLVAQACLFAALLGWERLRPLPPPSVPLRVPWSPQRAWLVGVLGGLVLLQLDQALTWLLAQAGIENLVAANEAVISEGLEQAPALTMVSIGLLAPWLEERLFRGRLLGRFRNGGRPLVGLMLTSLLFALLHEFGPDPGQRVAEWLALLGLYTCMGAMFGLLYLWSGRLSTAIVAHAVNNLVIGGLDLLELA